MLYMVLGHTSPALRPARMVEDYAFPHIVLPFVDHRAVIWCMQQRPVMPLPQASRNTCTVYAQRA